MSGLVWFSLLVLVKVGTSHLREEVSPPLPELKPVTGELMVAGDTFVAEVRVPNRMMELSGGVFVLPKNSLTATVVQGESHVTVSSALIHFATDTEIGVTTFGIQFTPTIAGTVVVSAFWNGQPITNSPSSIICREGAVDPQQCTTDFGTSEYFKTHPLPQVGIETCFKINTFDTFGNPVDTDSVQFEALAGIDDKASEFSITSEKTGVSRICFSPADADSVSVTIKVGTPEPDVIPGFPVEIDCLPGKIVPDKTEFGNGDQLDKAVVGDWQKIFITTYDVAGHVSNPDVSKTTLSFTGPGTVKSSIALDGPEFPQSGKSVLSFFTTTPGYYELVIHVDGDKSNVIGPLNITVHPSAPDSSKAVVRKSSHPAVAGLQNTFRVISHDTYQNLVAVGGLDLIVDIEPVLHSPSTADIYTQITDTQDGIYVISWRVNIAGVYSISVKHKGQVEGTFELVEGCPFNVTVEPGPLDPKKSGFKNPIEKLIVAGVDPHIVIQERDAFGNPRSAHDESFELSATISLEATGAVSPVTLVNNRDGTFGLNLDLRVTGKYILIMRANDVSIAEADFEITPGVPSAFSSVVVNHFEVNAIVNEDISLTIRMRDLFGNDLKHGGYADSIVVEAIHPGIPPLKAKIVDLESGQYLATIKPLVTGFYNAFVYFKGHPLGDSPYSFKVTAGPTFGPFSYAAGAGLHGGIAGEVQQLIVRARDIGHNDVTIGATLITGVLIRHADALSASDSETAIQFVDNHDGTYSGSYEVKEAGDFSMIIRLNEKDILGSPFAVQITPNVIGGQTLVHTKELEEKAPRAGEVFSFIITSRDAFGNVRLVGGDKISVAVSEASQVPVMAEVEDLHNGTYAVSAQVTRSGKYLIKATVNDFDLTQSTNGLEFFVLPGAASAEHSTLSGQGIIKSIAGLEAEFALKLRDKFYNDLTSGDGVVVTAFLIPTSTTPKDYTPIEISKDDGGDGSFTFSYTPIVSGQYSLKVLLSVSGVTSDVHGTPSIVTIDPASAFGPKSFILGSSTQVQAGAPIHFVLHAIDKYGNTRHTGGDLVIARLLGGNNETVRTEIRDDGDGLYYIKFVVKQVGTFTLSGLINSQKVPTNIRVEVLPGRTTASKSTADFDGFPSELEAGVAHEFEIFPFDLFDNPTSGGDSTWSVAVKNGNDWVHGTVSPKMIATFTCIRAAPAEVRVLCDDQDIVGSPFTVQVVGSATDAKHSTASGTGLVSSIAGEEASFTVSPLDRFLNPSTRGSVNVEISDPERSNLAIKTQEVGPDQVISFLPLLAGQYKVAITVNDVHLAHSPYTVSIHPGKTSAVRSQAVGGGLQFVKSAKIGQFFVVARDAFGNYRKVGGDQFNAVAVPVTSPPFNISMIDSQDGSYHFHYRAPLTASDATARISVFFEGELVDSESHLVTILGFKDNETAVPEFECFANCSGHGRCDTSTGLCRCQSSYMGLDCSLRSLECPLNCSKHGHCDHFSGECTCESGYTGSGCETDPNGAPSWVQDEARDPEPRVDAVAVRKPTLRPLKCPLSCSGHGKCIRGNRTDACQCDAGYVGDGCQVPTRYNVLVLDHGFVLVYEVATGHLLGFQQGMAQDKSCAGLNMLRGESVLKRPSQRKYVSIGNFEVLEIDPITSHVTLLEFDFAALADGDVKVLTIFEIGAVPNFKSHDLTYLSMNRLMLSTETSSTIYRINRKSQQLFVTELSKLDWAAENIMGLHYLYAGHNMIGRFDRSGVVKLFTYDRETSTIHEPAIISEKLATVENFDMNNIIVLALPSDNWLLVDQRTANYVSFLCPVDENNNFAGCTFLNQGNVYKGYSCATAPPAVNCADLNRLTCLQSERCGYCLATNKCEEGDYRGPKKGFCENEQGESVWLFTMSEFSKIFTFLGHNHALEYEPASGKYVVWNLNTQPLGETCRVLEDEVATGFLQNTINHQILSLNEEMLDFETTTGKFRLATCDQSKIASLGVLRCDTWATGSWPLMKNRKLSIIQNGNDVSPTLLLDYDLETGDYRIWPIASRQAFEQGAVLIPELPEGQGTRVGLMSAEVTKLTGLGVILARQPISSTTWFFEIVGGKLVDVGKPVSDGVQVITVDGKRMLSQSKFESMGPTTMLEYGPLGSWKYLECSKQSVQRDIFHDFGPIHCTTVSEGTPLVPSCATKTDEAECVASPSCGWCRKTMKCFPGSATGTCNKNEQTCPVGDWVFVGGKQTTGTVQETPQKSTEVDCSVASDCRTCVADSRCGFIPSLKQCVAGNPLGPTDKTSYDLRVGDWSYYFCTGVDGCGNLEGCAECSRVGYCGYCASTSSCVVGTPNGPSFGTCASGYTFDAQKCPV